MLTWRTEIVVSVGSWWCPPELRRVSSCEGVKNSPASAASLLQGLNMAVNAFVKWSLGSSFDVTLLGVSEMPKPGTKLSLDFASLLGELLSCGKAKCLLLLEAASDKLWKRNPQQVVACVAFPQLHWRH